MSDKPNKDAQASTLIIQAIERKGSDDNCHLHIGKTKRLPTRHMSQSRLLGMAEVGRGSRRYRHYVQT